MRKQLPLVGLFACLLLTSLALPAQEAAPNAAKLDPVVQDPVVEDVVAMLRAKVAEDLVLQWLETQGRRPEELEAADLIALKQAGASEGLMAHLLELSTRPVPAPPAPPAPASAPEPPPVPPAAQQPTVPSPAAAQPPAPRAVATAPADSEAVARFRIEYRPLSEEDEEPWDLYVYLDGDILSWVPAGGNPFGGEDLAFLRRLAPGRHHLLLVQERHEGNARKGWRHRSRAFTEVLDFEVAAGSGWEIGLDVRQVRFRRAGQDFEVTWNVSRAGEVLLSEERRGAGPENWPLVCEDLEAGLEEGEKPSRPLRSALASCRPWRELWPAQATVPSREVVLGRLEAFDFRPQPVNAE